MLLRDCTHLAMDKSSGGRWRTQGEAFNKGLNLWKEAVLSTIGTWETSETS
jgi:hypothetical protein